MPLMRTENSTTAVQISALVLGISIIVIIFSFGCIAPPPPASGGNPPPDYIAYCSSDADCIPQPSCHPHYCINKNYEVLYQQPQVCTALYDCQAAYSKDNCACQSHVCINKRLYNQDPGCMIPVEGP